jgi:hypothetical protein
MNFAFDLPKDTIEQGLQGKIAIDRLFARQCKVETNFDRFSREVKGKFSFIISCIQKIFRNDQVLYRSIRRIRVKTIFLLINKGLR